MRERIDSESIAWLTHEQLRALGVARMGDRTRILRQAQLLQLRQREGGKVRHTTQVGSGEAEQAQAV